MHLTSSSREAWRHHGGGWLTALVVLASVLLACGSTTPSTIPSAGTACQSLTPSPGPGVSTAPGVATAPATPEATGPPGHAFPALEARLPTQVGGQTLATASSSADPALQDAKTLRLLELLGKTAADLQLASATKSGVDVTVGAFRVVGADADRMVAALCLVDEADPQHTAVYGRATLAERAVVTRSVPDRTPEYIYPLDDIMFVIQGSPELAAEAIGQLPLD